MLFCAGEGRIARKKMEPQMNADQPRQKKIHHGAHREHREDIIEKEEGPISYTLPSLLCVLCDLCGESSSSVFIRVHPRFPPLQLFISKTTMRLWPTA